MASPQKEDKLLKVTDEDLQYLAGELTGEWLDLARHLKIPDSIIYDQKIDNQGHVKETKYQTLLFWKRKEGQVATYGVLAEALSKANRCDLSNKFLKEGKVRKRLRENEPASDTATSSESKQRKTEWSTVGGEPVQTGLGSYQQFLLQLESLLTHQQAINIATSFGFEVQKIENIRVSTNPGKVLVQFMNESGIISPCDISKLFMVIENESGLKDVAVKVKETFDLYGKFYEEVVPTLESLLTCKQAVLIAEYFEYPFEKIDMIRKSDKPSRRLVQFMEEKEDISPTSIAKLISALNHETISLGDVAVKVNDAFELLHKKTQFLKELREKYKNLCRGILPVPFLREKYDIDKLFVESGIQFLEDKGDSEAKEKWKCIANHKMIFSDPKIKSKRRIIDGEPGYGKSTLALQMTHEWCEGIAPMRDFEILILLRLRHFRNVSNVYAAIRKFLLPRDSKLTETDIENILGSSIIIILLDGYDEYPGRENKETDIECIINGDMFQNHEVVLMTRTSCLPQDTFYDTKRIRLTGFDDNVRFTYILNVVTNGDYEKAKEINQVLESEAATDLCQVPMFCVMISHMAKENKFQDLRTVTKFFSRIIACFHSHEQRRAGINLKQRRGKRDHSRLDKIAFEGLRRESLKISWDENELRGKIGDDLYEDYVSIGILREEDVFDEDTWDYKTETTFFHKLFAEWYAAHYLVDTFAQPKVEIQPAYYTQEEASGTSRHHANSEEVHLLSGLVSLDVHHMYRFACGLSSDAALEIITYLGKTSFYDTYPLLCIAEWMTKWNGSFETIENTVNLLCSRTINVRYGDSLLVQETKKALLKFAYSRKIPMGGLQVTDYLDIGCGGNLSLKLSGQPLPVFSTLRNFVVSERGGEMKEEDIESVFQYSVKCPGLKSLEFTRCLVPRFIRVTESSSILRSRDVKVLWLPGHTDYLLNLASGQWQDHELTKNTTKTYEQFQETHGYMTDAEYQQAAQWAREWAAEGKNKRLRKA